MKSNRIQSFLLFLTLLLAGLCRAEEPGANAAANGNRRIMPNDTILIRVVNEAELTMDRHVNGEGKITYLWLGELDLRDKSTTEVEKMIRDGLHPDYIINPQVAVEIKEYVKQFVTVNGQVNNPGRIELPTDRRLTLIEVLSLARDFTQKANKDKIEVSAKRFDKPKRYKYDELRRETDPAKQVYVEPNDVIDVAQSVI